MKVTLGMVFVVVPPIVLLAPLNVCVPVLAVYVPLFDKLPAKPTAAAADSLRYPSLLMLTLPVNVFTPVALVMPKVAKVPFIPSPIVVVPVTVHAKAPAIFKVALLFTIKLPATVFAIVASVHVFTPLPEIPKIL